MVMNDDDEARPLSSQSERESLRKTHFGTGGLLLLLTRTHTHSRNCSLVFYSLARPPFARLTRARATDRPLYQFLRSLTPQFAGVKIYCTHTLRACVLVWRMEFKFEKIANSFPFSLPV